MARRRTPDLAELDVVPIMSLIVHLIPMLLLSARFVALAQVQGPGPVLPSTPAPSAEALGQQTLRLVSVQVTREGFVVGGSDAADPRIPCRANPCGVDDYDYAALNQAMRSAKRLHPTENRVVIAPAPEIAYEVILHVMDATRGDPAHASEVLFPDPLLAAAP